MLGKLNFYGFVYSLGFLIFYYYIQKSSLKKKDLYFFLSLVLSILVARIFHVLDINNINYYLRQPIKAIEIWNGGLAWFGGVIGFIMAQILYLKFFGKKETKEIIKLLNRTILLLPIMIMLGRVANYLNQENEGIGILGIPQQIFEALTQGLLVFLIVLFSKKRVEKFIMSYSLIRLFTELFRTPFGIKENHFVIIIISIVSLIIYRKIVQNI